MKANNPLSQEFLVQYPIDAARVLEQIASEHVTALFAELPLQTVAPVLVAMLPGKAATCLGLLNKSQATKLLEEMPTPSATRIFRLLTPVKQNELLALLPNKTKQQFRRYQEHPSVSAGALLNPEIDLLPESISVAEAIRRIERLSHSAGCEIYIVDDAHHLVGMIELGDLLRSNRNTKLADIMSLKTNRISVHATAESLQTHPGWAIRHKLPVVERDNTLLGLLHYSALQDLIGESDITATRDPMESMLSLAGLYWLSLAQLLDSLLTIPGPGKGEQQ